MGELEQQYELLELHRLQQILRKRHKHWERSRLLLEQFRMKEQILQPQSQHSIQNKTGIDKAEQKKNEEMKKKEQKKQIEHDRVQRTKQGMQNQIVNKRQEHEQEQENQYRNEKKKKKEEKQCQQYLYQENQEKQINTVKHNKKQSVY